MRARREGFSLIEVIVAMLILAVGVLAMGAATGYILGQVRASELRSERMVSVRQATELLRGTPWANLAAACNASEFNTGDYDVDCSIQQTARLAYVMLITTGPGYTQGHIAQDVVDTLRITIARP